MATVAIVYLSLAPRIGMRKVVVLLGPLFGIANVLYLSLAPRIGMRIQGTPRVQREILIIRIYVQKDTQTM